VRLVDTVQRRDYHVYGLHADRLVERGVVVAASATSRAVSRSAVLS
jgi:hypothetical protein